MQIISNAPLQPSLFDAVEPTTALDRGECGELDTDTMTRCTGRRTAGYEGATDSLTGFPVWTCSACSNVVIP